MHESTGAPPQAAPASSGTIRLTVLCLFALVAGVAGGVLASPAATPGAATLAGVAEALVRAWTNAFRLLIAPLVVSQLYLALASGGTGGRTAGRLGLVVPAVFAGLLLLTAAVATALALGLIQLPLFAAISLHPVTAASIAAPAGAAGGAAWVDGIIPPNLLAAATTDNILPLMLFTVVFALAMRHADEDAEFAFSRLARGCSQACFKLVGWLLRVTPIVILALAYRAALDSGLDVGEAVLGFAGLEAGIVLVLVALLYPVTSLVAGVPPGRLARALWPAQLTALATRSSLASLPALFRGAESPLVIRPDTSAYVLPLAGATLKLSRAATGPIRLLFLGHVLGIPLGAGQLVVFTATIILLSASTVGVPSVSSGNRSLPAYVAAGIPAEYVVLLGVAVNLTDMFLTLFNTTGYLSATAIVERLRGRPPVPAPPRVAVARTPGAASLFGERVS
jgi:Na+/H+-dicarboxylate symporter